MGGSSANISCPMVLAYIWPFAPRPGRASTCKALGMMGDNVFLFIDKLTKCFKDRCAQVKIALMLALPGLGAKGQMYASAVGQEMYAEDSKVRVAAVTALGEMGSRGAALVEDMADLVGDA